MKRLTVQKGSVSVKRMRTVNVVIAARRSRMGAVLVGVLAVAVAAVAPTAAADGVGDAEDGGAQPVTEEPAAPDPDIVPAAADEVSAGELARTTGSEVLVSSATSSTSATFALPDGSYRLEVTSGPTRVFRAGEWLDIDTTLVDAGGVLRPRVVPVDVSFSGGGSGEFAMFRSGSQSYGLSWPDTLPVPTVDGDTAVYEGLTLSSGETVDVTVRALKTGFSHGVVLHEPPKGPIEIRLPVTGTGGVALAADTVSDRVRVTDSAGRDVVTAGTPRMWDSSLDEVTGDPRKHAVVDVAVEPDGEDGQQVLVLRPDPAFLADPGLEYPVVVDPDITKWPTDTWIQNTFDSPQGSSTELKAGYWNSPTEGGLKARSFLKFDVSSIVGKQIIDTDLRLYSYYTSSCTKGSGLEVRRVTSSWATSSLTWDTSPQPSTTSSGMKVNTNRYGYSSSCPKNWMEWDIDTIVSAWASGSANYGVRIKAVDESDSHTWTRFHSANYASGELHPIEPQLTITYNNKPSTPTSSGMSSDPGGVVFHKCVLAEVVDHHDPEADRRAQGCGRQGGWPFRVVSGWHVERVEDD